MDRFLIAPFEEGLRTDLKPWQIPADSFERLENAYIFRGRVKKRFGSSYTGTGWTSAPYAQLNSRLRHNLKNTDGAGNVNGTIPGIIRKKGQMFSIGNHVFTVIDDSGGIKPMFRDDLVVAPSVATFNATNGDYNITGALDGGVATPIFWYPAQPVMGLDMFEEGAIGNQTAYAFDTQFAYYFSGGTWARLGTATWTSTNLDFFWGCNWRGATANIIAFFVTNFKIADPMYFRTTLAPNFTAFAPKFLVAAENTIKTARIIMQFKNRLLLLNTIEELGAGVYQEHINRCRYSQNGDPTTPNAFLEENQVGYLGGGYIDAPTMEEIISAEFIKDRLIVYFERSTFELVYTGNEVLPFVWQKINTELGSESPRSSVPFDKMVLTIGNTGVHACNGANVQRVDDKIPDSVFEFQNKSDGLKRIAGIRDYFTEMVYWTFPSVSQPSTATYPTRVLVYNYKNGSWAFNDDCITAFGYFEQYTDMSWFNLTMAWQNAGFTWNSGVMQSKERQVIAGNQQGYVFTLGRDVYRNAGVMQITNITFAIPLLVTTITIIDHTLKNGDFIKMENVFWTDVTNPLIPVQTTVPLIDDHVFKVTVTDKDTITIDDVSKPANTVYSGRGTASRVSNIGILSKQWNPYVDKGRNVSISRIDFCVDRTSAGAVTVDYYPSATRLSLLSAATNTSSILGTGTLETSPYPSVPLEASSDRLWHPLYFSADGQNIQIYISMSDAQMLTPACCESNFNLEGLVLYTRPTSTNLQ
jgi:hypothetical protein